jgi:hypothetical protein
MARSAGTRAWLARVVTVVTVVGLASPVDARGNDDYVVALAARVRVRLGELAAARAPKLVPPVPIAVKWKAQKLASVELGAPLVALVSGDLDGDKKTELYAVTARHVIAFATRGTRLVELGRVAFTGDRQVPAPRDAVGTAVIEGRELVAAVSGYASELRVSWQVQQGKSVLAAQLHSVSAGFLVCTGERAQLVPGKNHFTTNAYAVRCRTNLVDRAGHPLRLRAELAMTGKLAVALESCPGGACRMLGGHDFSGVGVAFELTDVDRDGTPDVIVSSASAPGDPDTIKVHSLGGDPKKPLFKKKFNGGVAGLATMDGDGDGAVEVIAAVRLAGATVIDLWRLN